MPAVRPLCLRAVLAGQFVRGLRGQVSGAYAVPRRKRHGVYQQSPATHKCSCHDPGYIGSVAGSGPGDMDVAQPTVSVSIPRSLETLEEAVATPVHIRPYRLRPLGSYHPPDAGDSGSSSLQAVLIVSRAKSDL